MKLLVSLFLLVFPLKSFADSDCYDSIEQPVCAELGYVNDFDCKNETTLVCPFDPSYKWCKQYACEDGGYYNGAQEGDGWDCSKLKYHGLSCYICECTADDSCKYSEEYRGEGILDGKCCNGLYRKCEPDCPIGLVRIPKNATAVRSKCWACGQEYLYNSDYSCNPGYTKSDDNKKCIEALCEDGYSIDYQSADDCNEGEVFETKGKSGELLCGKCTVTPDTE